jgi:Rod binding domain-containing protein
MADPIRSVPTPPTALPRPPAAGGGPGAGQGLTPEQLARTRQSAQDFEAMAIGQLLQPMFRTIDTSKGILGGGKGEEAWRPIMVDEMAKMLAKGGGIGLADSVYREMLHMQETKDAK